MSSKITVYDFPAFFYAKILMEEMTVDDLYLYCARCYGFRDDSVPVGPDVRFFIAGRYTLCADTVYRFMKKRAKVSVWTKFKSWWV